MRFHIHEMKFEIIEEHRLQIKMSSEEMPCEADWAETVIDTDAVVPRQDTTETSGDDAAPEMMSDQDDDDDMELFCGCEQCECALLLFYPDYLAFIKRLSASEIDIMTTSRHRTMQCGYRTIQGFIDALWSSDTTVTDDDDHILDVWKVVDESCFCHSQLYIWKKQMAARKLING
jgi:hypothetical protein